MLTDPTRAATLDNACSTYAHAIGCAREAYREEDVEAIRLVNTAYDDDSYA